MESEYVTIEQAKQLLGVGTRHTVARRMGALNYGVYQFGKRHYYKRSEVEEVVNFFKNLPK